MLFKSAKAISLGFVIFCQQATADYALSALYNSSFGGAGQPPNITAANRDDPASALAMMEFTRLVAYSACNAIPFMEGLNGTLASGVFQTSGYENDALSVGNQTQVGTILAYAAASAQVETFQGDLESVFEAIFGFNVTLGQTNCSALTSSPPAMSNLNLLFSTAVNESLLPTTPETIYSWIDFFRKTSQLHTQNVTLSSSAIIVSYLSELVPLYQYPAYSTYLAAITGINHDSSDIVTTNLLRIVNNPSWNLESAFAFELFVLTSLNYAIPSYAIVQWPIQHIAALSDQAIAMLSALMCISASWNAENVVAAFTSAIPDVSLDQIEFYQYILGQITSILRASPDPASAAKAHAALFWLLSESTQPAAAYN